MKIATCFSLLLVGLAGCSDSAGDADDDGDGTGTGSGTGTGTTGVCYDIPVNTTSGGEACGDVNCPAGEFCDFAAASDCQVGCQGDATCPQNQYCDLSTADPGTCRTPGPEHEIACTGTNTGVGTGTGTASCLEICESKLDLCGGGAPAGICQDVCTVATPAQQECLQAAMCEDFADGEECGLSFSGEGD
jgi:hypothetical protein